MKSAVARTMVLEALKQPTPPSMAEMTESSRVTAKKAKWQRIKSVSKQVIVTTFAVSISSFRELLGSLTQRTAKIGLVDPTLKSRIH